MDSTNIELATQERRSAIPEQEFWDTKVLGIAGKTSDRSIEIIEKAFESNPGVKEFLIDREQSIVTVIFDVRQTNMAELHELLLRSGYNPPLSVSQKGVQ